MAVFTIGSKTLSGSPTGGAVGGASNLTTVGAIPYVSASGVLNQDATKLFWDSANSRLGVGTASPDQTLTFGTSVGRKIEFYQGGGYNIGVESNELRISTNSIGILSFYQGYTGTERARFAPTTGNLLVGGTTDGNYKLDVQTSGSTGTLRVYDQTATTGSTLAVIQAGAGQSGNLTEWRNNAGTVLSGVASDGRMLAPNGSTATPGISFASTTSLGIVRADASSLEFVSDGVYRNLRVGLLQINVGADTVYGWTNASNNPGTTKDLGLARNAAGVLEINNGTAGTLRDLKLRNITVMDTTATTGSTLAVIQAGAGQSGPMQAWKNNAGTSVGTVDSSGNFIANSFYAAYSLEVSTSKLKSGGSGIWTMYNSAESDFSRLQFGGTTSSFPALKRSGSTLSVVKADDSGPSDFTANSITLGAASTALYGPSAFVLAIGGTTSSFPALKRSSAGIDFRLADDSAYTTIQASLVQTASTTVASLPAAAAGNAGSRAYVTDANATTIGSTVAGGGSNKVMVWSNGTNWKIYAS